MVNGVQYSFATDLARKEHRMTTPSPTLTPAAELAARSRPYPNDSPEYRQARTTLLAKEIELRRQIEEVAALRRQLPPGGIAGNYQFRDENGKTLGLSDLFGRHDTLLTYFWMYGPERDRPCPMCTGFLGSLDQPSRDATQRFAIAVLGRSPVARQLAFARERGWTHLSFYETVGDDFARDYRGLDEKSQEWAALDVWVRKDGVVRHFWGEEMADTQDPGQDPRGAPDLMTLWNLLDLTPGGRGKDWYPKLEYGKSGGDGVQSA